MRILKRLFGCTGELWGGGERVRAGGGGEHFKGITAGVGVWRRVRFQGFLNSLL